MAVNLAQTTFDLGGVAINYMPVVSLIKENDLIAGAVIRDLESGTEYRVRARAVINATCVFSDGVRKMDEPDAKTVVAASQGSHVVLPKAFLPGNSAIMVPHTPDGRVMFAVPWHDHVVVGTTDIGVDDVSLEPVPMDEEIGFILTNAAKYLTKTPSRSDVLSVYAGLRPLVKVGDAKSTAALSRDHTILISGAGLLTIAGGKWTTYRKMAEDAVDQAQTMAGLEERPCKTEHLQVHHVGEGTVIQFVHCRGLEKVEVPGYFRLAVLILRTINSHNRTLVAIVERTLTDETRALLDALLIQDTAGETIAPRKTSAYKLTLMKKLSQSTKPSKVKERAGDLALVERLYQSLQPVLDELALNQDGIQYYAHSVIKAEIFQLTRREEKDRYLHLLAFIVHQYYRLQDNLVDVLLSSLQSFQNGALREHKEQCYARRELRNESLKALIACVDMGLVKTLAAIAILTEDNALPDSEKVQRIRTLLSTDEAKRLLEKDNIAELKEALVNELVDDDYYAILAAKSLRIQNRVSPILKALTFLCEPSARELQSAIEHFKNKDGVIDKAAPVGFLSLDERKAVTKDAKFLVSLYKALLFLHVQGAIKSGTLNLKHSYKYRPLDDYLIDRDHWHRDKAALIERAQLQSFVDSATG